MRTTTRVHTRCPASVGTWRKGVDFRGVGLYRGMGATCYTHVLLSACDPDGYVVWHDGWFDWVVEKCFEKLALSLLSVNDHANRASMHKCNMVIVHTISRNFKTTLCVAASSNILQRYTACSSKSLIYRIIFRNRDVGRLGETKIEFFQKELFIMQYAYIRTFSRISTILTVRLTTAPVRR